MLKKQQPNFYERIRPIIEQIPKGKVATYGQIAALAGSPRAARQVGRFLYTNGADLPWHRVIAGSGYITIQHPVCTSALQKQLLEKEGVMVIVDPMSGLFFVDLGVFLWHNFG